MQRKGGGGIRTHVGVTQDGFQDRCLKPLGHATTSFIYSISVKKANSFRSFHCMSVIFVEITGCQSFFMLSHINLSSVSHPYMVVILPEYQQYHRHSDSFLKLQQVFFQQPDQIH